MIRHAHIFCAAIFLTIAFGLTAHYPAQSQISDSDAAICPTNGFNEHEACMSRAKELIAQGLDTSETTRIVSLLRYGCDYGDVKGCIMAAEYYQKGMGDLAASPRAAANLWGRACGMGDQPSCETAFTLFTDPNSPTRNMKRAVTLYFDACKNKNFRACELGAYLAYDGGKGRYPDAIDMVLATEMAKNGCNAKNDLSICLLAEAAYGNPDNPSYNDYTERRYSEANCKAGSDVSCSNIGVYHQNQGNWPKAIEYYNKSCTLQNQKACGFAQKASDYYNNVYLPEQRVWNEFQGELDKRNFNGAVYAAIYHFKSKKFLEHAIGVASQKYGMGSIDTQYLYITANWFSEGATRKIVDKEMAVRGTGLEGRFGTGTNAPGMAAARSQSASGGYRPSSLPSSNSFTPSPMPSASQIAEQTRQKYHWNNCVMSKIPNNPNC